MCPLWSSLFLLICFACFALFSKNAPKEPMYLHTNALWIYTWNKMSVGTVPSAVPTELQATQRQVIRPEKDTMSASTDLLKAKKNFQAGMLWGRNKGLHVHRASYCPRQASFAHSTKTLQIGVGRRAHTSGRIDISHLGHQSHHTLSTRNQCTLYYPQYAIQAQQSPQVWFCMVHHLHMGDQDKLHLVSGAFKMTLKSRKLKLLLWQYWLRVTFLDILSFN